MKSFLLISSWFICIFVSAQYDSTIIYFDFDRSTPNFLNENALRKLKEMDSVSMIVVEGYTDSIGSSDYNLRLAQKRIQSILPMFEGKAGKIESHVVGESVQFGSSAANRRVLILTKHRSEDTLVLALEFINREAVLLEKSYPELVRLIEYLKQHDFKKVELHGHVCCTGNYQLSLDRAKTVEKELIRAGFDPEKITCFGHSNSEPRYPETNTENEAKNRRVEAVILY